EPGRATVEGLGEAAGRRTDSVMAKRKYKDKNSLHYTGANAVWKISGLAFSVLKYVNLVFYAEN
ncbi:TPA: hypothetical protein ACKMOZ_002164, partial [Neisseria gonorrhoeae]